MLRGCPSLGLSGHLPFMSSSSTLSQLGPYHMKSSRALLASGLLGNPAVGGGKAAGAGASTAGLP